MSLSLEDEKLHNETSTGPSKKSNPLTRFLDYKLYPRAHEVNERLHDPAVRTSRLSLLKAAGKNFFFLQTLFFAVFLYLFGGLYKQTWYVNHLNVAFVDYDGGAVGEAVRSAYGTLRGKHFPMLQERTPAEFPDPQDLRHAVCKIHYWGGLYIQPGASQRLQTALATNSPNYNKTDIMQYIWNEARYSAVVDSDISANLLLLSNTAKPLWAANTNWSNLISTPTEATFTTFANPWVLADDNIQPTKQGTRIVYNTLVVILIMIQEFFYLGTLNQLYDAFKIYTKLSPHRIIAFRFLISFCYCLIGSLCVTGAIWIFKAGWDVDGNQFVLCWLVFLLFAHLNFLTLDVFTVWLPGPFVPMALVSWLVLNVVSILVPFELQSDFYKWSYAMPAHNVYNTLIDIWSHGCNPTLHYTLPILFAYEVSSFLLAGLGVHRRCHYAIIKAEAELAAANARIESAISLERKKRNEEKARFNAALEKIVAGGDEAEIEAVKTREEEAERGEAVAEEEEEGETRREIQRLMTQDAKRIEELKKYDFGPSFGFGFATPDLREGGSDGAEMERSRTYGFGGRRRKGSIV